MDFLLGGAAAMGAGFFSNPFDVVKTRMQLQGELQSRGQYSVHYKNVPHAIYMISKNDGVLALQKGLVPALGFQLVCNSIRLGIYQTAESRSWTTNVNGETDSIKSLICGLISGVIGGFFSSPLYLVKTQIQSSANNSIAVGFQHNHENSWTAFKTIYLKHGVPGLFKGVQSSIPRVGIGSAVQLAAFARSKDVLRKRKILLDYPLTAAFVASNISGIAMAIFMCPFDVISTRLYNQDSDSSGKGRMYKGITDCGIKIIKAEGLRGVYKGVGPFYLRIAPHTILCLIFWDYLKAIYTEDSNKIDQI